MKTLQMALPPRIGFALFACVLLLSSQTHPTKTYASPAHANWILPIKPPAHLLNPYLAPETEYSAGHRGLDYLITEQASLLAPQAGEIRFIGLVANKPVVSIAHASGYISSFEPACSTLKQGELVELGQEFATTCFAGYKSHCEPGLCLHYGLRFDGDYLSPLAISGAIAASHLVG